MTRKRLLWAICFGAALALVASANAAAEQSPPTTAAHTARRAAEPAVALTIRAQTDVTGRSVRLGEIAELSCRDENDCKRLEQLVVARAPALGRETLLDIDYVRFKLRQAGFKDDQVRLDAPDGIRLTRQGVTVTPGEVQAMVREHIAANMPWPAEDVEVEVTPPRNSLILPRVEWQTTVRPVGRGDYSGYEKFRVSFRSPERLLKELFVAARIRVMTEVWTAARNIERGQRITGGLVRRARVELQRQRRNAIEDVDQLRGKRAKRSIRVGQVLTAAMLEGMDIVSGLPEFLSEDDEFIKRAVECGVRIHDIRKPPPRSKLHNFNGSILNLETPVITVLGTDCAVGKRTTTVKLVEALKQEGINAVFIATGQTGLLQGAKYGVAVDVLSSGFSTGEVEQAVMEAQDVEHPDIIVVEGQGALSHPAFTSTAAILRGANPDAVIIQHPPRRTNHCDFPGIPMPTLASEIGLIELFSKTRVIAITLNHEDMSDVEVQDTIFDYEQIYGLPVTDVLKNGCDKLITRLYEVFPELAVTHHSYVNS